MGAGQLPSAVTVALGRFTSAVRARFGEAHDESDVDVLVVIDGLTESERRDVMGLAYDADAADRQAWVGLAPLPYATTQADELRAREKRLLLDIGREGIAL
jgi:hypothetical protein